MSGERTTRACVTLRSRQLDSLREISRQTGAPVAELTRRAIDEYLEGRRGGRTHPDPSPAQPPAARA